MAEPADLQRDVFDFLGAPSTHSGRPVRRIDTHGAAVFLAGDRAYKVKRAVRFPFLDYSTLAKRHAACLTELEVSRPLAPQLYRRVVAITRDPAGTLAIDGKGEPVEWAVEMVRFDENSTFDRLASRGLLTDALADKLAIAVAAMHKRAPEAETGAWVAAVADFLEQNAKVFGDLPQLFAGTDAIRLDRASRLALERLRPLLKARGELGFVRRGHGDLHLGNIVLLEDQPVLFDAIEFDPVIAAGDVLYDLAFLLMDLVERRLGVPANVVLNSYLGQARRDEHLDGLRALPFFMSLRAAIRAKVTAARLQHADAADQNAIIEASKSYFSLALRVLAPPPPKLIAVGGLSGTGKSSVAQAVAPFVAPIPGAVVLRSDVERKLLFGVKPTERLSAEAYRPEVTARVYAVLGNKAARVADAGHSVIVDAVFAAPEERAAIAAIVAEHGVAFQGLFLAADLNTRLQRIGARVLDASDANDEVARRQEAFSTGRIDWQQVDAEGSFPDVLAKARSALGV